MSIGIWQVLLILVIVLILFGAGKLPKVMGDVAKGVKNFKQGLKDEDETVVEETKVIRADQTVPPATTAQTGTTAHVTTTTTSKDEVVKG